MNIGSDGSVIGHALQCDPGAGGYRDVDYPGDDGPTTPGETDAGWHQLSVTVRGSDYELRIDGRSVAQGKLPRARAGPSSECGTALPSRCAT